MLVASEARLAGEPRVKRVVSEKRREQERRAWEKHKALHPESVKAAQAKYRKTHPYAHRERARTYLVRQQVKKAGRPRPTCCDVCGTAFIDKNRFRGSYDHDHVTGNFRGWLCIGCNTALGMVNDSVERLRLLIAYLEKFSCS